MGRYWKGQDLVGVFFRGKEKQGMMAAEGGVVEDLTYWVELRVARYVGHASDSIVSNLVLTGRVM